ncbi:hypothetical protein ALMP_37680 [Streptomyces sp. A012304]|nr:hypothetical protein ALMP_37680 [Streptomyces sp. A012304]
MIVGAGTCDAVLEESAYAVPRPSGGSRGRPEAQAVVGIERDEEVEDVVDGRGVGNRALNGDGAQGAVSE